MKKRIPLFAAAFVIVIAAVAVWVGSPARPAPEPVPEPTSTLTMRSSTAKPYPSASPFPGAKKGVAIPGWSSIDLPAGVTEADVKLYNPTENDGLYNLVFELRLQDSGETLFTTGMVLPGTYCSHVTLTRALSAGRYEGVMHVQPVRAGDLTPTNNADISLIINVR